ncbi:MAG: hypothetical protein IJT43_08915 [Stomatobaculum sp.]|nr:hypothetical protein [Stomatobaculum sp.]
MRKTGFCRTLAGALLFLLLSAGAVGTAFAYDKDDKPIQRVNISIRGYIEIETDLGEEELEIHTSGNKYSFDHYEVQNDTFYWTSEDVPDIKIYLAAEEGYYFRITKASQITLNGDGVKYVSAAREDNGYTLVVEVKLPPLNTQVKDIPEVNMKDGVVTWEPSAGAGSYEVKFMRNMSTLGGVQTVTECTYDGSKYMTRAANYHCMVRPVNEKNPEIKGHWTDSSIEYVNEYQANIRREANAEEQSAGTWENREGRWHFTLPDGNNVPAGWRQINEKWYNFDDDGFARTGWYLDGDKWYYLDENNGDMWKNSTTPDGYYVGIDGVMEGSSTESNALKRPGVEL